MKWREIESGRRLLRRCMRSENAKVTNWLVPAFDRHWPDNLPSVDGRGCFRISSPFNLRRLVQENEVNQNVKYRVEEGLVRSLPTDKFLDSVGKWLEKNLPTDMQNLTFKDIGEEDSDSSTILGTIDKTPENDGVSAMMSILIPVRKEDMAEFKSRLMSFIEDAYVYGYDLTSIDRYEHKKMEDVVVLSVQFESRFSNDRFGMADVMYHVAPLKILPKIRKNGLVPKSGSSEFKYKDRVYLFNKCPLARMVQYGKYKAEETKDDGFCLFTIFREKIESLETFKDGKLNFYVDWAFDAVPNVEAMFTYGNIPLSVMDDECEVYMLNNLDSPTILKFK